MNRVSQNSLFVRRLVHTLSRDGPSETLKKKVADIEKRKKSWSPKKDQLFVEVPESRKYLDTATLPMYLTLAGIALFAKLLMMVCVFILCFFFPGPFFVYFTLLVI